MNFILRNCLFAAATCLLIACGGGGGGDGDDGSGGAGSGSDTTGLATSCGVITEGDLYNPISTSRGESVQLVAVLDSNAVVVTDGTTQTVVKLQGIGGTTGFNNTAARELFETLSAEQLTLFRAGDCTGTVIGGQLGTVGSIVTASGKSFTEQLIAKKYGGVIETTGDCGESSLTSCFMTLSASNEHHAYGAPKACSSFPGVVHYNPADVTSCGGNASLTVDSSWGSVFSIQLRYPDGTDRIIESCESAQCTPLKVQDYNRSDAKTVACFGAPGNSVALSDINHVSIKREADDGNPPRYCIADPAVAIN